jgi:hypothetical protein
MALNFLRRPTIRLRGGATHKHDSFAGAQAVSFQERLDGLLVIDDSESPRPVGALQAAVETPRIEYAKKQVPDIRERIRVLGQRAGAGNLDHGILPFGEFQDLWKIGPRLRWCWWHTRLHDTHVVDDEAHIGMAAYQCRARVEVTPKKGVHREIMLNRGP